MYICQSSFMHTLSYCSEQQQQQQKCHYNNYYNRNLVAQLCHPSNSKRKQVANNEFSLTPLQTRNQI